MCNLLLFFVYFSFRIFFASKLEMKTCEFCKCTSLNTPKVTFHRFPTDPALKEQWIKNIGKPVGWIPKQFSVICSDHFDLECFDRTWSRVKLKKGSIPKKLSAPITDPLLSGQDVSQKQPTVPDEVRARFLRPLRKVYCEDQRRLQNGISTGTKSAENSSYTATATDDGQSSSVTSSAYPAKDQLISTRETEVHEKLFSDSLVNNQDSFLNSQDTLLDNQNELLITQNIDHGYETVPFVDDQSYEEKPESSPVQELLEDTEVCRFCAASNDYLIDMFVKNDVVDKVNTYLPIEVSIDDMLPLKMCPVCYEKINMWHTFVVKCLESDIHLRRKLGMAYKYEQRNIHKDDVNIEDISSIVTSHWKEKLNMTAVDNTSSANDYNITIGPQVIILSDIGAEEQVGSSAPCDEQTDSSGIIIEPAGSSVIADSDMTVLFEEIVDTDGIPIHEIQEIVHEKKRDVVYGCERCGVVFPGSEELVTHQISDHNIKAFRCNLCNPKIVFNASLDVFRHHMSVIHKRKDEKTEKLQNSPRNTVAPIKIIRNKNCGNNQEYSVLKNRILKLSDVKSNRNILYFCSICNKRFVSKNNFIAHSLKHGDEKRFRCDICNKRFRIKTRIRTHMINHSNYVKRRRHLCIKCGKTYKSKVLFDRHQESHLQPKYLCQECGKVCNAKTYNYHIKTHKAPFEMHVCNVCGKNVRFLQSHMQTHSEKPQYDCKLCGKVYSERYCLKEHLNTHTQERPYKCPVCPKAFCTKQGLKQHSFHHTKVPLFQCEICFKRFRRSSYLRLHSVVHCREKTWTCQICSEPFSSFAELIKHRSKNHTEEEIKACRLRSKYYIYKRKEKCIKCGSNPSVKKKCVCKKKVKQKKYKCDICNKGFISPSTLKNHYGCHTGEKPFSCKYCDERFRFEISLTTHEYQHTGEKPFKCEVCEKSFTRHSAYKQHQLVHSDVRNFACETCGKCFKRRNALQVHYKVHTGERPYPCRICGRRFKQHADRNKHEYLHGKYTYNP